jgi:transcriptional regulator
MIGPAMYLPSQFTEPRIEELHRIVRETSLGMMVRITGDGMEADHLPFLLDADPGGHGTLIGHVARSNPVWREIEDGAKVLVVFRGVQGYISPNWYPGKQQTHRYVPTWNYEVVHAHGTIHVRDDEKFVRGVVARLTRKHEADQPVPWKMGDAPTDYLARQLSNIVGIEIRLTRLDGKRKLNQHHRQPDREGAIQGLEACGNHGLAQAMCDTAKPSTRDE